MNAVLERRVDAATLHSIDAVNELEMLIAAGEHWQMRKEYDEARRCFRLAMRDGGESGSDPIANLLSLALDEGDAGSVTEYDKALRALARDDEVSPTTCPAYVVLKECSCIARTRVLG